MNETTSARAERSSGPPAPTQGTRLGWVDGIKGIALIWIFLNHAVERVLGCAHFCNPVPGWPPLAERLRQLVPLEGYGGWGIALNLVRYIGWTGDQGVQLFLIASGFGLTWGLLERGTGPILSRMPFLMKRGMRLYPMWWGVHGVVLLFWILGGTTLGRSFFLSLLGIRFTRSTYYSFSPSWWFVGLLIQLYALYPTLWNLQARWGSGRLLFRSLVVCLAARAVGIYVLKDTLDLWLRGAVFITRLPEFVLGMLLASVLHRAPELTDRRLRSLGGILASLAVYAVGTALGFSWLGMIASPFLLGAGALGLLYPLFSGGGSLGGKVVRWVGLHSYSLYLVHHPILNLLLPESPARVTAVVVVRLVAGAVLTLGAALGLEAGVGGVERIVVGWFQRGGLGGVAWRVAAILGPFFLLIMGLDRLSRRLDPMEIEGWGERPSFEPDDRFGWKLRPSQVTHLRWQGYDYRVTANALGFPGPDYPQARTPGTIRLLTTGDAFTSAEGVDTDQAWPRRLERTLSDQRSPQKVEVLNFAISGYGPDHYLRVIRAFAPLYHPDLIIVELYVNDFEDVLTTDEAFRDSIRFGGPDPDGLRANVRLENLRAWCQSRILNPFLSRISGQPDPNSIFVRGVSYLERGQKDWWTRGRDQLADRMAQIKAVADAVGARLLVVMAPAAVQVCSGEGLDLFPSSVDLSDRDRFDLDLPQRLAQRIMDGLSIPFLDLRTVLKPSTPGIFQRRNMHWTVLGNQLVADHLAAIVSEESARLLPSRGR